LERLRSHGPALKDCAAINPERTLPVYLGFLKAAEEWLRASNDLKRRVDLMERAVDEISSVLPVIALAMKERGKSGLGEPTSQALLELAKRGYFETAGAVRLMRRSAISCAPVWRRSAVCVKPVSN
jgi:hypothetical protein